MKRKIVYWGAAGVVAAMALLGGFSYVTNAPDAIENFRHVGRRFAESTLAKGDGRTPLPASGPSGDIGRGVEGCVRDER